MNNNLRKKELEDKLKSRGLEFRSDSALCAKYVEGTTDLNIEFIVNRMCQMKYLYEYCYMNDIKSLVYNRHYIFANRANTYIKSENNVSLIAEKEALDIYSCGKYPEIYPWENPWENHWEYFYFNWKLMINWLYSKIITVKYFIF
jgi:hypothetical protein